MRCVVAFFVVILVQMVSEGVFAATIDGNLSNFEFMKDKRTVGEEGKSELKSGSPNKRAIIPLGIGTLISNFIGFIGRALANLPIIGLFLGPLFRGISTFVAMVLVPFIG